MSKFNFSLKDARSTYTANYFQDPGTFEAVVRGWRHFVSRDKHDCFTAQLQITQSDNPRCPVGAVRDIFIDVDDKKQMGPGKLKNFLIAGNGFSESLDSELINNMSDEKWLELLQLTLTQNTLLGNKVIVRAQSKLRQDAGKAAKDNPDLYDDEDFMKKNSYVAVAVEFHQETRDKLKQAQPAPAPAKK